MILKISIILISGLIYVSPLSADYSEMIQAIENYRPPEYYTNSLRQESANDRSIGKADMYTDTFFLEIENLKLKYDRDIENDQKIAFISDVGITTFSQLSSIASDIEAAQRLFGNNLKLNEIEIIAALRNPAVLAAQKKIKAELESFNQVMDLDTNLKQYSAFTEGINNRMGPLKMKESIKQKSPYPGLTSLKSRVISEQVATLVEKMRVVQKGIITDSRKAYWDLVFIERSIGITSETIDAFNRLKAVATTLYKSGKTSFQDVIKINIKIQILMEDLATLLSKKKNVEVKLRELLNLPSNTNLGNVVTGSSYKKVSDSENLNVIARQNRQELKIIRHQINKVQNMIEMAESMIQDTFTLNFSFNEDEAVNSVGTGAKKSSFPEKTMAAMKNASPAKPWYGVDNPWLNQTRQNLSSLKQTLVKQENATDRMVREAWFMTDKNLRELKLYRDSILPLSKSALDVTTREYESGSISFSQAIGSYTDWLKVKLTIAKKQTDLGITTAILEKIIGKSF